MSTKTNFKRIALVAVASLGLGVLSSVPSQASVSTPVISGVVNGSMGVTGDVQSDSLTAATFTVSAFMDAASDSISIQVVPSNTNAETTIALNGLLYLTDTGFVGTKVDTAYGKGDTAANTVIRNQHLVASIMSRNETVGVLAGATSGSYVVSRDTSVAASGNVKASFALQLDSTPSLSLVVPGTYTYTVNIRTYEAGVLSTARSIQQELSIVVSRSAAATLQLVSTASPATSWITLGNTTANLAGTTRSSNDSSISVVATASTTDHAFVRVNLRNVSSGNAQESVTATISGAGRIGDGTTMGRSVVLPYTTADRTAGYKDLTIEADGTAGVATITVTTTSVTFSTKSVTFYAVAPKTLVITTATPLLQVGTNDDAIRVTATDANGVLFAGTLYSYATAAADEAIAGTARTSATTCTFDSTDQRHECSITGTTAGTATITISNYASAALATAAANGAEVSGTAKVTVSTATAASVKISFDKASYAPGERARIYVTPLDSAGKAMQTNTYTNLLATGGISTAAALTFAGTTTTADSLTAVTITTKANSSATSGAVAGAMEYTVFMPVAGGTVTISATGGAGLPAAGRVATTATATVTDSGAAALAAVNALATTVASLRTLITTLTNLVLKIQKKVRA